MIEMKGDRLELYVYFRGMRYIAGSIPDLKAA